MPPAKRKRSKDCNIELVQCDQNDLNDLLFNLINQKAVQNPKRLMNFVNTTKLLLQHGADPNAKNKAGLTPLLKITQKDSINAEIVLELLNHGANPNVTDKVGNTPLIEICSQSQNIDAISHLIKFGADVNSKCMYGVTALHSASYKTNAEVMSKLLENGAEPNAIQDDLNTCIHLLTMNSREKSTNTILKAFELLYKYPFNPNVQDEFGNTPLHSALIYWGSVSVVNCLLDIGVDWNIRSEGFSFLEAALFFKKMDMVKCMLLKQN